LLADEPTGNLDTAASEVVLQALDDIHAEFGTTLVLVTHSRELAEHTGRVVELVDGRIVNDEGRNR
jgi:ABC-type lipoprotein export system ATPase subunit